MAKTRPTTEKSRIKDLEGLRKPVKSSATCANPANNSASYKEGSREASSSDGSHVNSEGDGGAAIVWVKGDSNAIGSVIPAAKLVRAGGAT